ncbi:hypothetical protein RUM44_010858 [Polyplax serrata]|uniref:Coiled-coil domain-containing protein 137 n=1 Tax=Polyplax serrata TaxID=468196 RepID=A0ABR1ANC6_POLSC
MGRKIPGKKHRTVKDPNKQQQNRLDKLKDKINNPPRNPDDQEIPKSLRTVIKLKTEVKKRKNNQQVNKFSRFKGKRKKNKPLSVADVLDYYPNSKPTGYIPNLIQGADETPKNFLRRLNFMTNSLIEEVKFEKKFGVEIKKDEETGKVLEVKKVKSKKRSKKKKLVDKRKEKALKKKEFLSNVKDFSQLKDNVKFGEVVERPPNLTVPKKSMKTTNQTVASKPKFGSLLLNKIAKSETTKQSALQRERAESERKFIVEAYRRLKSKG